MDSNSSLFLFYDRLFMKKAVLFWSAGKDSAMALYKVQQDSEIEVIAIITTLNEKYQRISMHGISEILLERQVEKLGIPLIKMWVPNEPDNNSYEEKFLKECQNLIEMGIDTIIFGDIFLEDLRLYRENLLNQVGLKAQFPLWKICTKQLLKEFIELGFRAITCCISLKSLDNDWIGKQIDEQFLKLLPVGVDPCGENGEFHTFCYAGPVFKEAVPYKTGELIFKPLMIKSNEKVLDNDFIFIDIL